MEKSKTYYARPRVMGILNATPDSFFAASRAEDGEAVAQRVEQMLSEGVDIIDVGGYSTRPFAPEVSEQEECRRVLEALATVASVARGADVRLSVDTFRSGVAEAVLERYGNVIINDITAGQGDDRIVDVAAHYGVPMVAMHTRGTPQTMATLTDYDDVVAEVRDYLFARAEALVRRGVREVILDVGFGFAKSAEQCFELMARLGEMTSRDFPMLVGISRKSFIYRTLGVGPEGSLVGTTALHWAALEAGASVLRVHDVAAARQTIELYEQIKKYRR